MIEGLGPPPRPPGAKPRRTIDETHARWIDESRALSGRLPRRYASIEDALRRMQEENPHLSAEQARHLTQHGVNQNEDGTYSWKFDNYVRVWPPYDMTREEIASLWSRITCPDAADPRQGELGEKPRRRTAAPPISVMRACLALRVPGTGCTTTGWTCSCRRCARS